MKMNRKFEATKADLERLREGVDFYDKYLDVLKEIMPLVTEEELIVLNNAIEDIEEFKEFADNYFKANDMGAKASRFN